MFELQLGTPPVFVRFLGVFLLPLLLLLLLPRDFPVTKTYFPSSHNLQTSHIVRSALVDETCVVTSWWGHQISNYNKSKFNISKNHISTTTRGKFKVFAPLYRSLIVKKYLQKVTPIWPLLPVQTGSQSLIWKQIHISTTTRGKFNIFATLYRSLIVKKYLQKVTQFDLYFLSKPEVKVYY